MFEGIGSLIFLSFVFILTEIRFEAFAKICNLKRQSSNPTRDSCKMAINVTINTNSFPSLFLNFFFVTKAFAKLAQDLKIGNLGLRLFI
jgi:hypothetical protein